MIDGRLSELVLLQVAQLTVLTIIVGVLAKWLMKRRPHLAHLLLLSLFIKSLIPPTIPGPWIPQFVKSGPAVEELTPSLAVGSQVAPNVEGDIVILPSNESANT
ncbi:MAG: hypothetical protein AAF497_24840, partial [Planctomycetota bacterium]